MSSHHVLYYVHDPMCSWCYGFRGIFSELLQNLPDTLEIKYLVGGLAADSDEPMPETMQQYLQTTWRRIEEKIPGVRFNFDFWTQCAPRRSTYPACRAVITAARLSDQLEVAMIEGIQNAYYQQALNPSDIETLADIAEQIGMHREQFISKLHSETVEDELHEQIKQSRNIGANSFPSLVLKVNDNYRPVPVDYTNAENMLDTINRLIN